MKMSYYRWEKQGTGESPKEAIDSNGVWLLLGAPESVLSALYFASGSGNASGAVVTVGLTAIDGLAPVPVVGAAKTLSVDGAQDSIDVMFYPLGRIAVTVASLPDGATLRMKVVQ